MVLPVEDRGLLDALAARLAAAPSAEAAIALRGVCRAGARGLTPGALKAVWGRIEAARPGFGPVVAHGALAAALAADRWGQTFALAASPEDAVARARGGGLAVIAQNGQPWWARLLATPGIGVVGALPDDEAARPLALIVGARATEPTGDDRTFFVTDAAGDIVERLSRLGLAAETLETASGLKLLMIAGYVQAHDDRLADPALGRLAGVIGAAPVI